MKFHFLQRILPLTSKLICPVRLDTLLPIKVAGQMGLSHKQTSRREIL